jgi:hypothetical protein
MLKVLALSLSLCAATQAVAAEPISHVIDQLRCTTPPDVTADLEKLLKSGFLIGKSVEGADSTNCWALKDAVTIHGVPFTRLCASHEDPQVIAAHPKLYWRGPGTSPGTSIALGTTDKDVATRLSGFGTEHLEFYDDLLAEGVTDATCNSMSFL